LTDEKIILDSENAQIREVAGVTVQRIPKRWIKRADLQAFFLSALEIALVLDNGEKTIVIRRVHRE
jgi:hypothetical protein